jgi:hypothetical protein
MVRANGYLHTIKVWQTAMMTRDCEGSSELLMDPRLGRARLLVVCAWPIGDRDSSYP